MEENSYKLGHLEADIKTLKEDMSELKKDVRALNIWKWKTIGATGALASLVSLITTYIIKNI